MREQLLDILAHTSGLGFIETIRFDISDDEALVEAMDNDRTVVIKGKLKDSIGDLKGVFGASRLNLLQGLLNFPTYKADDATISVKSQTRDGNDYPEELIFCDGRGKNPAVFRLMKAEHVPTQAKFLGADWDVSITPSKSVIQEFNALGSLYSSFETYFGVEVVDGELNFFIGDDDSSSHRAKILIAENVAGKLSGELYWPISQVQQILKVAGDGAKVEISSKGAFQISVASKHAEWRFILPARKRG